MSKNAPISFQSPNFSHKTKPKYWVEVMGVITLSLIIWAILSANYIFALILTILSIIYYWDYEQDALIAHQIDEEGITLHGHLLPWSQINSVFVIGNDDDDFYLLYLNIRNWRLSHKIRILVPQTILPQDMINYVEHYTKIVMGKEPRLDKLINFLRL